MPTLAAGGCRKSHPMTFSITSWTRSGWCLLDGLLTLLHFQAKSSANSTYLKGYERQRLTQNRIQRERHNYTTPRDRFETTSNAADRKTSDWRAEEERIGRKT